MPSLPPRSNRWRGRGHREPVMLCRLLLSSDVIAFRKCVMSDASSKNSFSPTRREMLQTLGSGALLAAAAGVGARAVRAAAPAAPVVPIAKAAPVTPVIEQF